MSLNWKEIDLILNELNLPGMQIQKVYQSNFDVLALQVYGKSEKNDNCDDFRGKSRLLLVSLSPLACRFHETFRAAPKSEKPLRFAEFLKSRIQNGRIEEAAQLGDNRIIRIVVRRWENYYRLYIRLWSNAANVILTDEEGTILDAMKRHPKRGEATGGRYAPEQAEGNSAGVSAGISAVAAAKTADKAKQYEARDLPGEGSFNRRVDSWYAEHGGRLSLEQLREEVRRNIGKNRNRLETALERLREKESDYAGGDRYREYGDIILSNAASLVPGASWLEAHAALSGDPSGDLFRIELDPRKSPAENAARYYEKYRKTKNGLEDLREEIAAGEQELVNLNETEKKFLEETNPLRLEALLKKLRTRPGKLAGQRDKGSTQVKRPGLSFFDGEWLILVGRDAAENDELLRRHVKGNDLWLHVRDWPGSYVFIKHRPGKTVPLEILLDAGNLALFYSKGRNNKRGDLYYAQVKHLRRAKNGPKGTVIPTQEKNISVILEEKRLKKLEREQVY